MNSQFEQENQVDDLEVFARLTSRKVRQNLVSNSVQKKENHTPSPVTKVVARKQVVPSSKVKKAQLAACCCALAVLSFAAGLKVEDYRTYLSTQHAIVEELQEDVSERLPGNEEERMQVYLSVADRFDLKLTEEEDQAFLFYLMSIASSDREVAKENFEVVLNDYGYPSSQSFYARSGYYQIGDDGASYPSAEVYRNYMEARFQDHVEEVKEGGKGR